MLQKAYLEKNEEEKFRLLDEFTKRKPDSIRGYREKEALFQDQLYGLDDLLHSLKNKNLKHIKKDIQRQIDNYSELIRLDPTYKYYYEKRATFYIYVSRIDFMLSDDGDKFPSVNYNAVKDMEKMMSLESNLDTFIFTIQIMLKSLPNETHKKYIEQLIADLPPGMDKVSAEYTKMSEGTIEEDFMLGGISPKFEIINEV